MAESFNNKMTWLAAFSTYPIIMFAGAAFMLPRAVGFNVGVDCPSNAIICMVSAFLQHFWLQW